MDVRWNPQGPWFVYVAVEDENFRHDDSVQNRKGMALIGL
jgi:hypothetical protein